MTKQSKQESVVYLIIWVIIFAFPVLNNLYRMAADANLPFEWGHIFKTWKSFIPFLLMFLVHNHFIAQVFEKTNRILLYGLFSILLVASFGVYRYATDITERNRWVRASTEFWERAIAQRDSIMKNYPEMPIPGINQVNWDSLSKGTSPFERGQFEFSQDSLRRGQHRPGPGFGGRSFEGGERMRGTGPGGPMGPMIPFSPMILELLIAVMMLAANMGVKLYFKGIENDKKVRDLENENLLQQLQYLRYQINPHFFMNTLNNIHALVDIEPKEAKKSILELSKLMRYVLYEGGKPTIPLEKEVDFLTQYISLMRIRYTDTVKIDVSLPRTSTGVEIPPLLFVSFVENAFKHGISYKSDSFINVGMEVSGEKLHFWCENSRKETNHDPHSGIGLENVKKRLELLYGEEYTLDIDDSDDKYKVSVEVPIKSHVVDSIYNLKP